ncbi:hypothetical protein [Streptomyces sp. NPDC086519]|uniref:hypothetical protein n=1 Tax=Streptomyces sp. NPDC086519 TaxID=3154863 RepID=UPI00343293B1
MASAQDREPAVTDVHIPDDALKDGAQRMRLVHDNIDIGHTTFDFDAAFGRELSRGAAQNFEDRWNDGKHQLQKQVSGIIDAITQISDAFDEADRRSAASLDDGRGD